MSRWCAAEELGRGATLSLEQGLRLGQAWYHDRLDPAFARKSAAETQALFQALGLTGKFWQIDG